MLRQEQWTALRQHPETAVLIIGGGINGIGTFRDLALQGVDVLLVERADFCSAASAANSHMVHGGLRYLENAEFRLVKEALTERNRLLQNAPHYVKPLPTTIPIFKWLSGTFNAPLKFLNLRDKPGERGALIIKAGLTMYDLFTRGQQTLPRHSFASRQKSLEKRPALNPKIICTATYYDAWMPCPERIALELLLDAEAESPAARALNYVSAIGTDGSSVTLRDELTGETTDVRPQVVINATGAWIDFTNDSLRRSTQFIGGTKGSHLLVNNPELHAATAGHEIFFENNDGRITLFFPLEDKVLMGTTDIPVTTPENVVCTEEEVDYILSMVKKVFPSIQVDRSQIVFRFCGVRPLPNSNAATAGQISRDHSIEVNEVGNGVNFPIYSLVSGKWTTYRAFSEQTTDVVLKRLNLTRRADTKTQSIGGGKDYPHSETDQTAWIARVQKKSGLPRARVETLFKRYGTRAEAIALFTTQESDAPLTHHPAYTRREILFMAQHEKVLHLDDVVLRRSLMAMLGDVHGDLLDELASLLANALGWSAAETAREVERTVKVLNEQHGVPLERLRVQVKT